jgi:hypothetical protein
VLACVGGESCSRRELPIVSRPANNLLPSSFLLRFHDKGDAVIGSSLACCLESALVSEGAINQVCVCVRVFLVWEVAQLG